MNTEAKKQTARFILRTPGTAPVVYEETEPGGPAFRYIGPPTAEEVENLRDWGSFLNARCAPDPRGTDARCDDTTQGPREAGRGASGGFAVKTEGELPSIPESHRDGDLFYES